MMSGGMKVAAARYALSCCLTRCHRGHEHKRLGLQTLNRVKLYAVPAEMIAPLVAEGNCSSLDLKARQELMPREGVSASLAEVFFERADLPWQGLGSGHISVT